MASPVLIANHAKEFREELGLKEDDVVEDIISLITDTAGYEYEQNEFDEQYYGFSEYKGSGVFKICYNLKFDWNHAFKRFTLAHELGHISLHHEYLREHILHRCYTNEQFVKQMEIEADIFAANFLAPSNACSKLISGLDFTSDSVSLVASHFNISTYAAALRFIALTDRTCAFIVCNKGGRTEYERRSNNFSASFNHPFVHKTKIHQYTLTNEFINGKKDSTCCESQMSYWYPGIQKDAKVQECVIDLGYNDKIMTLLTPEFSDYEEFLSGDESYTQG
jgi:hypothetical protein